VHLFRSGEVKRKIFQNLRQNGPAISKG